MSAPAGREINPFAAPKSPDDPSGASESAYKPLGSRAEAVTVALGFWCVLCVASWVATWAVLNAGSSAQSAVSRPDVRLIFRLVISARTLVFFASAVCVGFFLPQANRNCRVLRQDLHITFSPASTVWWFFVPLLNLIRPYEAVKEIWQATDPPAEGILKAFAWEAPWYLPAWWGAWIGYNVVRQIQALFKLQFTSELAVVADGLSIAAAVLLVVIVRRIAARQETLQSGMRSAQGV